MRSRIRLKPMACGPVFAQTSSSFATSGRSFRSDATTLSLPAIFGRRGLVRVTCNVPRRTPGAAAQRRYTEVGLGACQWRDGAESAQRRANVGALNGTPEARQSAASFCRAMLMGSRGGRVPGNRMERVRTGVRQTLALCGISRGSPTNSAIVNKSRQSDISNFRRDHYLP